MADTHRSHGSKSIRPSLAPRDLMAEAAPRPGIWGARIITLLPQAFPGVLGESLTGRALRDGLWSLQTTDLRAFGEGRHRNVDDTPAGGGAGMVLRADVMGRAIDEAMPPPRPTGHWSISARAARRFRRRARNLWPPVPVSR
jgi:tRNA (guanine37-N1)-methyltransferase